MLALDWISTMFLERRHPGILLITFLRLNPSCTFVSDPLKPAQLWNDPIHNHFVHSTAHISCVLLWLWIIIKCFSKWWLHMCHNPLVMVREIPEPEAKVQLKVLTTLKYLCGTCIHLRIAFVQLASTSFVPMVYIQAWAYLDNGVDFIHFSLLLFIL